MKTIISHLPRIILTVVMVALVMIAGNFRSWDTALGWFGYIYAFSWGMTGVIKLGVWVTDEDLSEVILIVWIMLSVFGVIAMAAFFKTLAGQFSLNSHIETVTYGFTFFASMLVASLSEAYAVLAQGHTKKT